MTHPDANRVVHAVWAWGGVSGHMLIASQLGGNKRLFHPSESFSATTICAYAAAAAHRQIPVLENWSEFSRTPLMATT